MKTIVIANISEYYLPLYHHLGKKEIDTWVKPCHAESDMALFWGGDDKMVITPLPLNPDFVDDTAKLLKYKTVKVASPERTSSSLCNDILNDSRLFTSLVDYLQDDRESKIISWGASPELYELLGRFRQAGASFFTPEIPRRENYWCVPYLDSKSGFRELCYQISQEEPNIRVPEGFLCSDLGMATETAKFFTQHNQKFLIKANNGVGGYGILMYPRDEGKTYSDIKSHIKASSRLMPIFSSGIVIAENFIESNSNSLSAFPSLQAVVNASGETIIKGLAGQVIDTDGKYLGALVGNNILTESLRIELIKIGKVIGKEIASLGFVGRFNVDTILGSDNHLYCLELNARRSSVSYSLEIAHQLFGSVHPDSLVIYSSERLAVSLDNATYEEIKGCLSGLLFPIKGEPRGVIITIINSLNSYVHVPKLGFIVIGWDLEFVRSMVMEVQIRVGLRRN